MVSTRSKRRRDMDQDNNDNGVEGLLDTQQAEAALQRAESTRLQKAKKKKQESFQRHHPPLEMLPTDILTHIFLHLSDVCTIHTLSKCAKFVRKAVTPEVVIRAAVFGGAVPRDVLGHAMSLVGTGAIHVPTPFRILRFVLAKRCERGSDCFGYDLVTKKPKKIGKDRPYGLAICESCASCLGTTIGRNNHKINDLAFLSTKKWTFSLLTHPVTERGSGEPVGPWLMCCKVKQVIRSYSEEDKGVQVLQGMYDDFENTQDIEYKNKIIAIHSKAEAEYPAFEEAKQKLEVDKENAARAIRAANRKARVQGVLDELQEGLGDCEMEHKALILAGSFNDYGDFVFRRGPSRHLFGNLVSVPSAASKKRIRAACDTAIAAMSVIFANNFIVANATDFLRDFPGADDVPAVKALVTLAIGDGGYDWMMSPSSAYFYGHFFNAVSGGRSEDALLSLFSTTALRQAFVTYVLRGENDEEFRHSFRTLATNIWTNENIYWIGGSYSRVNNPNFALFSDVFNAKLQEYQLLSQNYKDYLRSPHTGAFLRKGPHRSPRVDHFTRRDAIEMALDYSGDLKEHLRYRRFAKMLRISGRAFRAGRYIYDDEEE